ncbi:MAG TPA: hypothetical protein VF528_07550 [Pyrinomonadaceae bacterium]
MVQIVKRRRQAACKPSLGEALADAALSEPQRLARKMYGMMAGRMCQPDEGAWPLIKGGGPVRVARGR